MQPANQSCRVARHLEQIVAAAGAGAVRTRVDRGDGKPTLQQRLDEVGHLCGASAPAVVQQDGGSVPPGMNHQFGVGHRESHDVRAVEPLSFRRRNRATPRPAEEIAPMRPASPGATALRLRMAHRNGRGE